MNRETILHPTRRSLLAGGAAALTAATLPRFVQAQSSEPIRLGFQLHRTGIGAAYGRWYERTALAALKVVNEAGGIAGRPVEILFEDDATDPRRGAEVVEKLASQAKVDMIFGPLFSHVVIAAAPRAAELKIPYLVCSEGYHVASGKLNRWTLQPGITDVRAQVTAMAPWVTQNLGKKVTMIFPDYAFGHDHRDFFTEAVKAQGGEVVAQIAIPPTETSFTRYFPRIPRDTEVLYHVMVGPAVLTFVKELGEFYGSGDRPQIFGFIDSLEAVDIANPGLQFLEGSHFWEGQCRMLQPMPRRPRPSTGPRWGWTTRAPRSRIRRTCPATGTCSRSGRLSLPSSRAWRPATGADRRTGRPSSRRSRPSPRCPRDASGRRVPRSSIRSSIRSSAISSSAGSRAASS